MRTTVFVIACFVLFNPSFAQQSPSSSPPKARAAPAPLLERKIRQAWEDYKNKKKEAFASVLTDDVIEVEEDGNGARDKKAELAEMDEINLANYALSDFHFRRIGSGGMLVRYTVEYAQGPEKRPFTTNRLSAKSGKRPERNGSSPTSRRRRLTEASDRATVLRASKRHMTITAQEREQIRQEGNVSPDSPQCLQPRFLGSLGSIEYCVKEYGHSHRHRNNVGEEFDDAESEPLLKGVRGRMPAHS